MNEEIRFAIPNPALKLELSQSATRKFQEGTKVCQSRAAHLLKEFAVKNGIPGLGGYVLMNHSKAFQFEFGYRDMENLVEYGHDNQVRIGQLTMPFFYLYCKLAIRRSNTLNSQLGFFHYFAEYTLNQFLDHGAPIQDLTEDDLLTLQTPLNSSPERLLSKLEREGRFTTVENQSRCYSRLGYILASLIAAEERPNTLRNMVQFYSATDNNLVYKDDRDNSYIKNLIELNYDDTVRITPNLSRHYRSIGNMLANVTDINPNDFSGAYGLTSTPKGLVDFCQNLLIDRNWHPFFQPLPMRTYAISNPGNEDWERCVFGYTQKFPHDTVRKVYKESFDMGSSAAVLMDGLVEACYETQAFNGRVNEQYGTIVGITCNLEKQKLYNVASKIAADFDKLQEDFWKSVTEGGMAQYPQQPERQRRPDA